MDPILIHTLRCWCAITLLGIIIWTITLMTVYLMNG